MLRVTSLVLLATLAAAPSSGCVVDDVATEPASVDLGKADDASNDPEDCIFDATDSFEPHSRMPKGRYRGRCLDTRQARSIVHLSAEQAAPYGGLSSSEIVVANVFHDDAFWVARIPADGIETVLFQLEYFPAIVPAGHTQFRLRFSADQPVRLIGQAGANAGATATLRDLVLSVEAIGQLGYQYDVVRGLTNEFGAVYRVLSLDAKVEHMIIAQDHEVEQWELELTTDEKRELLANFLDESDIRGMSFMYNTLFLNCTNELVRVLDDSVSYTVGEQLKRFLTKVTEFYPNIIRAALIARGLLPLDQSTDWPRLKNDPTIAELL